MGVSSFVTEDDNFEKVSYHISLLEDTGYIECEVFHVLGTPIPDYLVYRLTSFGHDYLDSVRDQTIYSETKKKLGDKFKNVSLSIVQPVAEAIIKSQLGI